MNSSLKEKLKNFLLWSQKHTQTDMLYIARGGFWTGLGLVVSTLFSLAVVVAFANLVPRETYGTYKYILSLAGALTFLSFSGMNTAVTQAVARGHEGVFPYSVRVQLKTNIVFLLGLSVLGGYYLWHSNATLAFPLFILAGTLPLSTAFNTFGALLSGKKEFKRLALWTTISSGFSALLLLSTVLVTHNLNLLISAYTLGIFFPMIFFYFRAKKTLTHTHVSEEEKEELVRYGGHLTFINIFSTLSQYVDKIVIFHFLGSVELAIYALALALPDRIKGYAKVFAGILLPKLTERSIADIKSVFYKRTFQGMAIGFLLSIGYILVAPLVFRTFLPQYLDALSYSRVFSLSLIILVPATYMSSVLRSQRMLKTIYLSSTVAHILRIILFILFGWRWGIWGVITASLAVYLFGLFYNFFLWELEIRRHLGFTRDIDEQPLGEESRPQPIE